MKAFNIALTGAVLSSVTLAQEIPEPLELQPADATKTFQEICTENAYQYEEHTVITEDGYILTVFRIPGRTHEPPSSKPPIYM